MSKRRFCCALPVFFFVFCFLFSFCLYSPARTNHIFIAASLASVSGCGSAYATCHAPHAYLPLFNLPLGCGYGCGTIWHPYRCIILVVVRRASCGQKRTGGGNKSTRRKTLLFAALFTNKFSFVMVHGNWMVLYYTDLAVLVDDVKQLICIWLDRWTSIFSIFFCIFFTEFCRPLRNTWDIYVQNSARFCIHT